MLAGEGKGSVMYEKYIKRAIDIFLSALGLLLLSWLYGIIALAVYIDDPGPVFFTQKRVGIHATYFNLHKFRSMKLSTPHDVPTHLLVNPEQYITPVGRFLRRYSLDELPQIWDIFISNMSIIGPRPALWNQEDLLEERDQYGANDVKPGLTGWAQIHGRDELDIPEKAWRDGEYTVILKAGGWRAFCMDVRCFFGTILTVLKCEGVTESGAAEPERTEETTV